MARALATLALVSALILASCGGNGNDTKTDGAAGGGAATGAGKTGGRAAAAKRKRSSAQRTVLAPKPGTPALTGDRKAIFMKARAACKSRGRRGIARDYKLHTENPLLVARLYAAKAYGPATRGVAFVGCVAGLR